MSVEKTRLRILVIDDCDLTRQLLTALLTGEGYHVTAAHDGMTGLTAARRQSPDLAIVDLHLPDLSGIELAGLLQPEVPFWPSPSIDPPRRSRPALKKAPWAIWLNRWMPRAFCGRCRSRWNAVGNNATYAAPCKIIRRSIRPWEF